jgi:parallel beta-helix repeat protein
MKTYEYFVLTKSKESNMKKILPNRGRRFLKPRFNLALLLITATFIFLILSCKKELAPDPTGEGLLQSDVLKNGISNFRKADIIVHKNGSIQAAVNAALPGMLIKIEPGTYAEAVTITQSGIKLIGLTNSNGEGVIIQNPGTEETGITVIQGANGFSLENITVRNFTENGILLTGVDGFYLSHVHAINNGEYGIFPVFCSHGVIEYCTANGHADTGIYVGQSSDVVIRLNRAFDNVNGIESENSDNIVITLNETYNNTLGIFADLLPGLKITSSTNIRISANIIRNNNHPNFSPPGDLAAVVPSGIGVLVLGTDQTIVEKNIVTGNNFTGIVVFSTLVLGTLAGLPPEAFADIEPNPDGARVQGNLLSKNGLIPPTLSIPLPGADLLWDGSGVNNCWVGNIFKTSYPSPLPSCN